LDPDFNIWTQISPYAQKLVETERGGPMQFFVRELTETLRVAAALPRRGENLLNRLEHGKLAVQTPDLKLQATRLELAARRLTLAVLFGALFLGGVQLYLASPGGLAYGVLSAALLALVWLILLR
jgi:predicted unusual protein kinase regulating ubiquinone biosynthesis (AarF/ABC1/UbiB family)